MLKTLSHTMLQVLGTLLLTLKDSGARLGSLKGRDYPAYTF